MPVRHLLMDLDNTLYPPQAGLMAELDRRISRYFVRRFHLQVPQAERLQAEYCWQYGSCSNGVLSNIPLDLHRFLAEVHDIDVRRYLRPDPVLRRLLAKLRFRKWVFTNAPQEYARRVLDVLGITDCFFGIFDIRFAGFVGKPDPQAYHRVLDALRVQGDACVMVEDSARNLRPAKALGMMTILVSPHGLVPGPWVDTTVLRLDELPGMLAGVQPRGRRGARRSA